VRSPAASLHPTAPTGRGAAGESAQASVEWLGLALLLAVALALGASAIHAAWLPRTLRCAIVAGCRGNVTDLVLAYGAETAALVRRFTPGLVYERRTLTLPVDFRSCRSHRCADAGARAGADVARAARGGSQATVFTHVVDRRAAGGSLYLQYWLYYPDSTWAGAARRLAAMAGDAGAAAAPLRALADAAVGFHADDWESYQLRISPDGEVAARASAHHGYAGRRRWPNLNEAPDVRVPLIGVRLGPRRTSAWTLATGWTRISRGSHAGHVVDGPGGERRTAAPGIALVPIEGLSPRDLATRFPITPPWRKGVYRDPESAST